MDFIGKFKVLVPKPCDGCRFMDVEVVKVGGDDDADFDYCALKCRNEELCREIRMRFMGEGGENEPFDF